MCGIFGIVSHQDRVSHEMLDRARESLAHRGPDDSGTIVVEANAAGSGGGKLAGPCQIGLAHTRLSIIDLSPLGHQPMHDPVSGNWIVYNGEIYNYP